MPRVHPLVEDGRVAVHRSFGRDGGALAALGVVADDGEVGGLPVHDVAGGKIDLATVVCAGEVAVLLVLGSGADGHMETVDVGGFHARFSGGDEDERVGCVGAPGGGGGEGKGGQGGEDGEGGEVMHSCYEVFGFFGCV